MWYSSRGGNVDEDKSPNLGKPGEAFSSQIVGAGNKQSQRAQN